MDKPLVKYPKTRRKLQKDIEHITQEMYLRNLELKSTNDALSLLRTIDVLVLESHESLNELCYQIAQAISVTTSFPLVGVLVRHAHHSRLDLASLYIDKNLQNLNVPELTNDISLELDNSWLEGISETSTIDLDELPPNVVASSLGCSIDRAKELIATSPIKMLYIAKLQARKKLVGVIVVGFTDPHRLGQPNNQTLLDRLGQAVGVAIDNKLLFEENQRVVKELRKSNDKLKALDEAKDEFISMASHQLRTPLTSMKGYVSMVLEGDAGKISPMQRKLLKQAFGSSQRMVYLIADLLNVSRLRTGKFVIERNPTNLAEVVEGELDQLRETAKVRNLTLEYDKPKHFESLMLDETKTRQVIMNFVDNAIYYTPAGGHIKVSIADNGRSVEFRVKDDGIGVPKADQHQLFGKFYRAGNARDARPDGTGLGLFMARKVIVAQGGSIIFESKEGKGSTFGFSFTKSKLPKTPS